jgi:CubicO group peptidase (beta-lactamase class C family)
MYDPWVTREFTITDLMAQRSGLPDRCGDDLVTLGYNRLQLMHSARCLKPATSFRSTYAYQNMPFLWAAAVVENLTNESWEENIHDRIFQPLGMANSSTDMQSFRKAKDVAYLHYERGGAITSVPMDWKYMDITYTLGPAGGINSNVYDMAKWLIMQMNNGTYQGKQLISKKSTEYLHSPQTIISSTPRGGGEYYCQGWIYSDRRPNPLIYHTGGTLGHTSVVAFDPRSHLGIVILFNSFVSPSKELADRFFDMYYGEPDKDYSAESLAVARSC